MIHVSPQVTTDAAERQFGIRYDGRDQAVRIDRTETSFGGKGCLTEEQYEKGMALSREMRDMTAW